MADDEPRPRLLSRVLVTWIELVAVGLLGALVLEALGGPPAFVAALATALAGVAVLLYNVDRLVARRLGDGE